MRAELETVHPVLGSRDVAASVRFYERLGFTCVYIDKTRDPRYAAVERDNVQLHLQWHAMPEWTRTGPDRPTYRVVVRDVDGLWREFHDAGILYDITPPSDTNWGTREFHVRDPDGNGLQFYRDLPSTP